MTDEEIDDIKVKIEVESEDEKGKGKIEKNKKTKKESNSDIPNGWDDEVEMDDIKNSSSTKSMSHEFRSNLVDLARETWSKSVTFYSIEKEPSVNDRFKMARFIIQCLEEKYGGDLLEILQFFTFQSFDPNHLKEKEEVIGLMMYLDERKLVAESFFFLLLAMNDKKNARVALDESEMCCRAQLKAAKIGRSILLGKPLQAQQLAVNREALDNRKNLEYNKYHLLFPGIIEKDKMKQLIYMKIGKNRELKKEITKNVAFTDDFWISSSKLFNVDSEWTTFAVNESAVRVYEEMNKMFEGSLTNLVRTLSYRIIISGLSDIGSGQSLAALRCMKNTGFFSDSLLFALLRFNDANAMKKSCSRLSRLCTAFKKVIEAGTKSKGMKTDSNFQSLKSAFTERALKVNADCMQYFEVLMNYKGRKRCLSTSSTIPSVDDRDKVCREPRKKKRKEKREETDEEEDVNDTNRTIKVQKTEEEPKEEEGNKKKKKKKKVKKILKEEKEETSENDDNECHIIPIDEKKVKIEVISSDDEHENEKMKMKKRKRKDSKKSTDGDVTENEISGNVKVEVKDEEEKSTYSSANSTGMEFREENMEDEDDDEKNQDEGYKDLLKVREMLTGMSTYWDKGLRKWNIIKIPTVEDRYNIARMVIKFYENHFGDEFHNALFYKTKVMFTPSDLQDKDEVIGLLMYMDIMWMSIRYFFFFIIIQNDESKVNSILLSCKDILHTHINNIEIRYRVSQGESVKAERNQLRRKLVSERTKLVRLLPSYFGNMCKSNEGSENGADWVHWILREGSEKSNEKKKNTPVNDTYWWKYANMFAIQSDWSMYDVLASAVQVLNQLNNLFHGSLISKWNEISPSKQINENAIKNMSSGSLAALMSFNKIKIFPDGLIFLLLRAKNEQVQQEACALLTDLVGDYLNFLRDFGPNFKENVHGSKIKDRSYELTNHEASQKCANFLLNYIKHDQSSGSSLNTLTNTISESIVERTTVLHCESSYNPDWKVTTMCNESIEWKEWERNHMSDMDRLTHRINDFMIATAMREEHYNSKVKVLDWLKVVLKDILEKCEATLDITGSSLCSVGATSSNLDVALRSSKDNSPDIQVILDVFARVKGLRIRPSRGKKIYLELSNESTEGLPMLISIYFIPSTHYMGRVYQMVDNQDERVAALSLVLKAWRLRDYSSTSKFQSYHVMSLLIHYLQCGVSPPIIPSLIRVYPHLNPLLYHSHSLPDIIPHENIQSLASLLFGFFTYYSKFEFEKYIISVREGQLLKRNMGEDGATTIMIEHPFLSYPTNLKSVFTGVDCSLIRESCTKALNSLTTSFKIHSLPTL